MLDAHYRKKLGDFPNTSISIDVTIIGGAGHVGIPLSLIFANAGQKVMMFDVNKTALNNIKNGILPTLEYDAETLLKKALKQKTLFFSSSIEELPKTGSIIVTIGTPVDEFLNPVHKIVRDCIDSLIPHMIDGQLLVLRSTLFPGTTEWIDRYIKKLGRNILVAFCPERIVQGHAIQEIKNMPQIISGTSIEAEEAAKKLFSLISPEIICVKPMEAEFAKLFSNAYRYIQFAISNQFYMISKSAGVDYYNIIHAMTHNYPRMQGFPSAGFSAGPCLFKDTMQLAAFSQNQFSLGHAAMLVNEGFMLFIMEQLRNSYDLPHLTVGLLGMAFKPDIDDTRASLSYKLKKILQFHAKTVLSTDPFVTNDHELFPLEEVIEKSDILVICTPHSIYKNISTGNKPIIDVWGFFR